MTPINAKIVNSVNAYTGRTCVHHPVMGKKTETDPSPFWRRLAEAWERQGLPTSQNGVAAKLGMSQGSTRRWYTGDGYPETKVLIELATRGKVTVDWLLTGRLPKAPIRDSDPLARLIMIWNRIDDAGKAHLLRTAEGELAVAGAERQPEVERNSTFRCA